MRMTLKAVPIAFPAIFTPQAVGDSDPAYGAKYPIAKDHPQLDAIRKAIDDEAKAKWGDKWEAVLKKLREDKRVCFVEAPYCDKNGEPYAGFEDAYSLSTRNAKTRPSAFGPNNNPIVEADGLIYSGAIVDAAIEIYAQDSTKWGRRINCTLRGVRYVGKGTAFSGGPPASADEFGEAVEQDDEFV